MTLRTTLCTAVCATALLSGQAAFADVTATQAWDDWKTDLALYGDNAISVGNEVVSDNTLTVSDVAISIQDDSSTVTVDMGDIVFTENGDGTVSVAVAETYPVTIEGKDGNDVKMSITQKGMAIVVSGTPEQLNYAVSADTYGVQIDEIVDGADVVEGDMRLVINDMSGTYTTSGDELRSMVYDFAANSIDLLVDVKEPGGDGYVVFSGKINDFATQADGQIPANLESDKPEDLFNAGFAFDGGYTIGSASYVFDIDMEGDQLTGSAENGAGGMTFGMDTNAVTYESKSTDLAVTMQSGALPFPVSIAASAYGIGFEMPLSKTEEPAPFGTQITLTDLTVNDEIWAMFDPSAALPRDPATITLDLTGTAKLFFDLLDPAQSEALASADIPGELHSLALNAMKLSVAGAAISGQGAFTFDNTDLQTFSGMPRPEGKIDFEITGANALLDKLVGMGLVPEEQAMPARMMMGMFARTVGDDQLTSSIEVNDQGHVLANGQRIQ